MNRITVCALVVLVTWCASLPAGYAAQLYWSDINFAQIRRSNLDGSNLQTVLNVPDLAYMVASPVYGRIYYSTGATHPQIFSANLDGSNPQLLLTLNYPSQLTRGLAIDETVGKLFWVSSPGGGPGATLRSMNVDGTGHTSILSLSDQYPYGTAVDPTEGAVFWANTTPGSSIERVNYDGTGRETVYAGPTPVGFTSHVAVDPVSERVFWTDSEGTTQSIYRADYDGTDRETVNTWPNSNYDVGMTVFDGRIYYVDNANDVMYRSFVDGTGDEVIRSWGPLNTQITSLSVVPEPASIAMIGLGMIGLIGYHIRRHGSNRGRLA